MRYTKIMALEFTNIPDREGPAIYVFGDGASVKEFYGLTNFPCVLILMDDDTIPQQWSQTIPRADEVAYALSQINGSMG